MSNIVDRSLHNQIIDKNFCERLKKSFHHDTHCYAQDDCLRITVTADEFVIILAHYFNMHHLNHDLSSVKRQDILSAINQLIHLKISQAVC